MEDSDVDSLMEEVVRMEERGRAVQVHKEKMDVVEELERSQAAANEERDMDNTERGVIGTEGEIRS